MKFILVMAAAAAAAPTAPADVLAPARARQMECYLPDTVNRTCTQLVSFAFDAKGGIVETQQIMIIPKPMVMLSSSSPVAVRGGALCGTLAKADVDNSAVTIDGRPAPDDIAAKIRADLLESDSAEIGKDFCETFQQAGDHSVSHVSIDGTPRPKADTPVIWVKPDDGYKLGGAP